ncbi:DNA gyrase subunit A [Candidatus Nitrosacidococcus tergens]|uniref:DNA gyrase subunit A n=1 Tax=Candidatus Nitrosacidococcus tergens TaxID=553981 RepID=A0A7G1Q9J2_9GAMM|nr:DNA gyrase subunit A [Candidatus Nitrosacidococcus tergens]CAB1275857.1 DNA gyrase (type II topoisomerase), subunit A [Candidatus Nitrosacidococcus tergens]
MDDIALEVLPVNIEDEMKQSYLDYAMSVIVGRALPDVRDGLKPVHRRVLYAMEQLHNDWNKPYKKSARIVGDVIGKYHPHGDTSVYDAIVRMAQPFAMRYPLIDGQGNFGSVDGDPPAAMRYTEIRMAKISHELLADLHKETVNFVPNYDEVEQEPVVLPTKTPNLLVNGSSGIAVGMATNIPPHNLGEVLNACIALIDDPDLEVDRLIKYIPGPDFPTAGIINGIDGILSAYRTGRGRVFVRARTYIENNEKSAKQSIIVTELPYTVNKARLLEKIGSLVKEKKIEGIVGLRDESDKEGMRMVIEVRRGDIPEVILNHLYLHTQLQTVFGINMVALVKGQPQVLNLKQVLTYFIEHRQEVVTRRTVFDLRKARERAHILEGLALALTNIDPIIVLIKASPNSAAAKEALLSQSWSLGFVADMLQRIGSDISRPENLDKNYGIIENSYYLSPIQAQAILDMRLHRLTGLEQDKIIDEYVQIIALIQSLLEILTNPKRLMAVIREELTEIKSQYTNPRCTEIRDERVNVVLEDLIQEESVVVTLSHGGYIKSQSLDTYRAQKRGGKGKVATTMKEEDFIDKLFIGNTHDTLLCFSSRGKVYWKKVHEIPQGGRTTRGKPIVNLLPLDSDEKINAILATREFDEGRYIFMATASGVVKKTSLLEFSRPRANGIIALDLNEDDYLINAVLTDGQQEIMLFSSEGKVIRFSEQEVRSMGRTARGVKGIDLNSGSQVIALVIAEGGAILTTTELGYGKCTPIAQYRLQGRGGKGIISIRTTPKNGQVIGATQVEREDDIVLITNNGTLIRSPVQGIPLMGRNTQGVKLINLLNSDRLVGIDRIVEESEST